MTKSISKNSVKPAKPHRDFPLYAHASGRWAKKIRQKIHYFGPWRDPEWALERHLDQKDDLMAGRVPRVGGEGLELHAVLNAFLDAKHCKLDSGELSLKMFTDYRTCCGRLVDAFGRRRLVDDLTADEFGQPRSQLAKRRGPVALGNEVQRVRSVFKHSYESGMIEKPMRFGPDFVNPPAKAMRLARYRRGVKMIEAAYIRRLLAAASLQIRGMIYCGLNCAYGNTDVAQLPISALDLETGIADFSRPKTGVQRRATLWPETVECLRQVIDERKEPLSEADFDIVFITKYGKRWGREKFNGDAIGVTIDSVGPEFGKLLRRLKIDVPGKFYLLRHTFETIGGETLDQAAVDRIMGHERDDMATRYRQRIDDKRLETVTDHVRQWLFQVD